MLPKSKIFSRMNELGSKKIPFLFIIDFEIKNPFIFPLSEINNSEILYFLNEKTNFFEKKSLEKQIIFKKFPISFENYKEKYENVIRNIKYGNTYLLNLTCETPISLNLSLREIFIHSKASYKLFLNNQFVVFSPEAFVKIENCEISSYPMKGTIDADLPNAEMQLLNNHKETAEHYTIVDLIRNDLNKVAKNVKVEKFRYIEKICTNQKNLLQMSSKISGKLSENFAENIGDIFENLLPAGSISGAPKKKTIEIILETEKYSRNFYTGIFGIFDGKNVDSGVMIRFIENSENGFRFKSGGGITSFSESYLEYNEMIDKVYVPIA